MQSLPPPLNYSTISSSKIKLGIVTTNAISGERTVFDNRASPLTTLGARRASATNLVIAGSPVRIGDGLYWDAILSEAIPA